MSPPHVALIGIGNSYRRDDAIGLVLVDAIERLGPPPGVRLTAADGEPSQLLDAWAGAELAIVVDAALCEPPVPGQIHRTAADLRPAGAGVAAHSRPPGAGTHQLGIPDAIRLALALDRAPRRLVVFAVEPADTGFGPGLSAAVSASLPGLIRAVRAELGADRPR